MIIFPSYLCNFDCPFCGIKKETSPLMSLDWLAGVLEEVKPAHTTILGGEPMLLKDDYLEKLIDMCAKAAGEKPSLYSNGSIIKPSLLSKTKLVISFDPEDREKCSTVLNNVLMLDQDFDFNTILTKNLVEAGPEKLEQRIKHLTRLKRIDLCLYYRFPGHEDMSAADVDAFLNALTDKRFHYLKHDFMKDFDEVLKVLPDHRYLVETPDHNKHIVSDTLEEARENYERLKNEFNPKL